MTRKNPVITYLLLLDILWTYLANIPGFDVLQFNQKLLITARLELFYKYPAVGRLLVQEGHKMVRRAWATYATFLLTS